VVTTYGYDVVNNLTSIAAPGLTAIGFTYDSLNRRTQMTDGTGATTFGYDLANQLTTIDGPLANDTIGLSYDALGRMTGRVINNTGAATLVYDDYGRPQTATNPLGTFTYNYPDPVSTLLSSLTATSGPNISFSYLDAAHDQRLGEIWHKDSANQTISKFNYEYDVLGQITRWTQQTDANAAQHYNFDYDRVSQLKATTLRDVSDGILKGYSYDYDLSGNRTAEVIDTLVNGEIPNNLNQLTNRQGGTGMLPIRGTTNVPAWVFINGNYAPSRPDNSFEGRAAVTPGDNTVTVEAIDQNGNTTTNQYSVTVTGSGNKTLVYDANGNLISDGTRTFEWDPLNRLTAVNIANHRSEFTYNGLSQRVKIVEKENGNVTSTKQFVWYVGAAQAWEERDASNTVTKRLYPQGEQISETSYYYTKDHLGSTRELTDSSGVVQTRYDYDPYGRCTKVLGDLDSDFSFTGFYAHGQTSLNFSRTRAYNSDLARWIQRDPIGERGGFNLYGYVANRPNSYIDPSGEFLVPALIAIGILFALDQYANAPTLDSPIYTGFAPNPLSLIGSGPGVAGLLKGGMRCVAKGITNAVPSTLARVVPGEGPFLTLGAPGAADVFVTDATAIEGMTAPQIAERLGIAGSETFTVIRFPPPTQGLASPVFRSNPGFVGGGLTSGGAPEFVIPNGPVPPGADITIVGPH
jgi:RHS repeat-associated protein